MNKRLQGLGWVLPALVLFLIFDIYPLISLFRLSLFKSTIMTETFVGLSNFTKILTSPVFLRGIKNTLLFIILTVPCTVFFPLLIAALASQFSSKTRALIRFAFYIPTLTAGVIVSMIWTWIFHPLYGLLNWILGTNIAWLGQVPESFLAISLVLISTSLGSSIIIYMASLSSADPSLYEAASLDGCSKLQSFFHITIPHLSPVIFFLFVTQTIAVSQIWEYIYLMTGGGPNRATTTIVYQIFEDAFISFKFGQAASKGVIFLFLIFTISLIQRSLKRKLSF